MKKRLKIIIPVVSVILVLFGILINDISNRISIINTKNIYLEKSINESEKKLKKQQKEINSLKSKMVKLEN